MTERSWNPWVEAVSGFGVLIVAPLLVAALLPVFLIGLSARRITRPIRQLAAYAERIAAGDFRGSPLLTRTGDEVEELAMRFDSMAGQLNSLYDSLEKRVDDRTAELLSVLSLARSVSQTFESREIADISRDLLRAHPNISDAMLWIDSTADGSLDLQSTAPDWVVSLPDPSDSLLSADSGAPVERPRILAEQGPSGMVYVLPVDFRESSAYLGVQLGADEIDDDLVRYLEAVAAQVAVALEGSVLRGRARTAAATEDRTASPERSTTRSRRASPALSFNSRPCAVPRSPARTPNGSSGRWIWRGRDCEKPDGPFKVYGRRFSRPIFSIEQSPRTWSDLTGPVDCRPDSGQLAMPHLFRPTWHLNSIESPRRPLQTFSGTRALSTFSSIFTSTKKELGWWWRTTGWASMPPPGNCADTVS